jgi:transcriptional regulator of acetoin/glycerol metabolism
MSHGVILSRVETQVRELANALAESIKQSTLEALRDSFGAGDELFARVAAPDALARATRLQPRSTKSRVAAKRTRSAGAPELSLDHYERMALRRALHEAGGDVLAAARLLGLTKSSIYRRMRALDIPRRAPGQRGALPLETEFLTTKAPVSLARYEGLALERALEEAGNDIVAAARLLKIGKSTMYRKLTAHRAGGGSSASATRKPAKTPAKVGRKAKKSVRKPAAKSRRAARRSPSPKRHT